MIGDGAPQADGSADSTDQVIQETPVAGQNQSFQEDDTSVSHVYGKEGTNAGAFYEDDDDSNVSNSFQFSADLRPYTPPADDVCQVSNGTGSQAILNSNLDETEAPAEVKYNRRTPNFERIAKFLKGNKTPGKEALLSKYQASELEDTPVSKRDRESPNYLDSSRRILGHGGNTEAAQSDGRRLLFSTGSSSRGSIAEVNEQKSNNPFNEMGEPIDQASLKHEISGPRSVPIEGSLPRHYEEGQPGVKNVRDGEQNDIMLTRETPAKDIVSNSLTHFPIISNGVRVKALNNTSDPFDSRKIEQSMATEASESSNTSPLAGALQNGEGRGSPEDVTIEHSRINDTTEGNISEMWVLRPNDSGVFNSNKSTQIINMEETDETVNESGRRNNNHQEEAFLEGQNGIETQVIASYPSQNRLYQEKKLSNSNLHGTGGEEVASLTQIIKSPEQPFSHTLETPEAFLKINFETVMEVPETSSPSKTGGITVIDRSSPTPREKNRRQLEASTQADENQEKGFLQTSKESESVTSQAADEFEEINIQRNTIVVVSDAELTQELPEIEEEALQGEGVDAEYQAPDVKKESKQEEVSGYPRKRGHGETLELTIEEENRSRKPSPKKRLNRSRRPRRDDSNMQFKKDTMERVDPEPLEEDDRAADSREEQTSPCMEVQHCMIDLPKNIRHQDDEYLSKEDIKFEDSVWCQYSLDYRYYPGRIISYDEQSDSCWVYFDTGMSLTKNDDVHYLDIRVGDTVDYKGKKHQIIALQCRDTNEEAIRCIRGYDTLHLRRKKNTGILGQKVLVKPLAAVSLDLNEWTKRPKIILENGSHTRAKAFQDLQHPIRGRKNTVTLSPRKAKNDNLVERANRPIYREESDDETDDFAVKEEDNLQPSTLIPEISHALDHLSGNGESSRVFDKCVFVLTGLNEDRTELSKVIESQGGEIMDLGFSELFDFESFVDGDEYEEAAYSFNLRWKENVAGKNYIFACLITKKHLRSLKYLETLALGWPTLHWKFIRECLQKRKLCVESIYQYLLPSGESYRLSFDASTKNGVIKSSNIYPFIQKLSEGLKLEAQLDAMKTKMSKYIVIVYGQSELNQFIKFSFACLGAKTLYHITEKLSSSLLEKMHLLTRRLDELFKANPVLNIVIYINKTNGISSKLLKSIRERLSLKYQDVPEERLNLHVESKEWLIQTIINASTGFDESRTDF